MPYNLPAFNTQRISIGPAIIYIGQAGQTPTVDLGAVYEAELRFSAEETEFYAGAPSGLQWRRSRHLKATLTVKGLEWRLDSLQKAIGGLYAEEGDVEVLYATGDISEAVSLRAIHQMPSGGTIIIDFFRAIPTGYPDISFGYSPHQLPFTFSALVSKYDFEGNPLPSNTFFKLVFQKPSL
ncbi:MAG: hypothetical protein QXT73_00770 [Candidatus Methanomethylicaceae archaeon]